MINFEAFSPEVKLVGDDPDKTFARVRETLTRMGIALCTDDSKTLTQSCYILHKRGRYYVMHYKMMRHLNGGENRVTERDIDLTATVTKFLENWGMVKVVSWPTTPTKPFYGLRVVKFAEVSNWTLIPKCTLGK